MPKFCMRIRIHHTMHDVNLYDKRLKVSFAGLKKGPCSDSVLVVHIPVVKLIYTFFV